MPREADSPFLSSRQGLLIAVPPILLILNDLLKDQPLHFHTALSFWRMLQGAAHFWLNIKLCIGIGCILLSDLANIQFNCGRRCVTTSLAWNRITKHLARYLNVVLMLADWRLRWFQLLDSLMLREKEAAMIWRVIGIQLFVRYDAEDVAVWAFAYFYWVLLWLVKVIHHRLVRTLSKIWLMLLLTLAENR